MFLVKYFVLATTYFPLGRVSSAQQRFTSLFGMGRGGATASSHQNKTLNVFCSFNFSDNQTKRILKNGFQIS